MICQHCNEPMKEYVGFNARAGDPGNPWDCVNSACSPKTTKPAAIAGGVCGVSLTWYLVSDSYACPKCGWERTSTWVVRNRVYTCQRPIPTQSEPDRSSAAPAATKASSPIQRRQGYQISTPWISVDAPLPLAPDLSPDDSDQCTLQQQGSDLPPKLGTPSSQYVTLDAETLRASMANPEAFLPIKKV